jgi:hypothetical protein
VGCLLGDGGSWFGEGLGGFWVAYIAAADAGVFDLDEDVVGVFEVGDGAVFEFDFVDAFEDEGEVLCVDMVKLVLLLTQRGRVRLTFAVSVSEPMEIAR